MAVTIVEHKKDYSPVFYEEPEHDIIPEFGFIMTEMGLDGYYSKFKKDITPSAKMYFSYAKRIHESMVRVSGMVAMDPIIPPFEVKKFRIITESDLGLDEFEDYSVRGFIPKEFQYLSEAMAVSGGTNRGREDLA